MGLLQIIKKLFQGREPVVLEDPVFGRLVFDGIVGWEGQVQLFPLKQQVEIIVEADESGPTDAQREKFKTIEQAYESLLPSIIETAWSEVREWDQSISRSDMADMLKLESISINQDNSESDWDITYYCDSLDHWVTIAFTGQEPRNVVIDG